MPHRRLRAATGAACALALMATLVAAGARAEPALVEVGDLVLRADGRFEPQALPKRHFAPISFRGRVDIAAKDGGRPSPVERIVIDFDRDGRLSAAGLPSCSPEEISTVSPEEARGRCAGAMVGTGRIRALIAVIGASVPAGSRLTLFNGPRQGDDPTIVLHASIASQTIAVVIPIERRRGAFRYRATLAVPPIAAGFGAITHIDFKLGRRFQAGGRKRSYVAGRCSDRVLDTRGRFTFADGTIIDGSVERSCDFR